MAIEEKIKSAVEQAAQDPNIQNLVVDIIKNYNLLQILSDAQSKDQNIVEPAKKKLKELLDKLTKLYHIELPEEINPKVLQLLLSATADLYFKLPEDKKAEIGSQLLNLPEVEEKSLAGYIEYNSNFDQALQHLSNNTLEKLVAKYAIGLQNKEKYAKQGRQELAEKFKKQAESAQKEIQNLVKFYFKDVYGFSEETAKLAAELATTDIETYKLVIELFIKRAQAQIYKTAPEEQKKKTNIRTADEYVKQNYQLKATATD